jgi:hypothetical protein
MTTLLDPPAASVASSGLKTGEATMLVQISGPRAWIIRQVLTVDPQPSVCTDCRQAVVRPRAPDGRRLRVDPVPEPNGIYLAHRLRCPDLRGGKDGDQRRAGGEPGDSVT